MSLKESTISPGSGEYSRLLLVNSAVEVTIALFSRLLLVNSAVEATIALFSRI